MRNNTLALILFLFLLTFHVSSQTRLVNQVQVNIDLNKIKNDKVTVTVISPKFNTSEVTYRLPKIVPGTYSEDDYGKFIDNLKAFDNKGKSITVTKTDVNSWKISNAKNLAKITYQVNDTFDIESTHDVFSPSGTNINAGKNILLNTHGFVGYFSDVADMNYKVNIEHPDTLWGATSMVDLDSSTTNDIFQARKYAELLENPIMYSKPDYTTFSINGMDILIAVYSPNGIHTAESITLEMEKMMTAQKNFLGKFNSTKKYSVLIYLSSDKKGNDAHGYGALEHPSSTTVVMPEEMSKEELSEQLKDVVSHEFFHIVTPLSIHSKEIQYFNFNQPKMSQHLWLYEGVTEYFANLFQINQGLISEEDFYGRMASKIDNASVMNDIMPFTKMSANVLVKPYKDQYLNVYEKGALIGMCLDILIREKSNGERGILDLMRKLAFEYGAEKPFNDEELFAKITEFTYPEVGQFLKTYVSGVTPIPYETFFAKVGVSKMNVKIPENVFLNDKTPYVTVNQKTKEIIVIPDVELNPFFKELSIKGNDIIVSINDKKFNLDNIYEMLATCNSWNNDDNITVKIKRDGKEQLMKGKVKFAYKDMDGYEVTDTTKNKLKEAWLKS